MRFARSHAVRALVCALTLLAASGCATFRHGKPKHTRCPEPPVSEDVKNMPPLRVPPGLDAPDTRNAIKVPPLTEPVVARAPDAPCLSAPPSFGKELAAYTGPSAPRAPGTFSWHVNGGGALTMGESKNYLSTGWTVGGGLTYRHRPPDRFALQLDLGYADFNATRKLIDLGQQKVQYSIDGGTGSVWLVTAAGKYTVPFTRNMDAYGLLGIGAYHEAVQLTESAIVGNIVCDPWGYCYPVATDGVVTQASKNLTKFGWNVGVGLRVRPPRPLLLVRRVALPQRAGQPFGAVPAAADRLPVLMGRRAACARRGPSRRARRCPDRGRRACYNGCCASSNVLYNLIFNLLKGEVAERSKALDWNSSNIFTGVRGFESHPLRHRSTVIRAGSFATTNRQPRQARKGAAVTARSGAEDRPVRITSLTALDW